MTCYSVLLACIMGLAAASAADSQRPAPAEGLRCEYLTDPLGIDVVRPRLSWIVPTGERGQRQTAYRIVVASSPAALQKERGDLWDSGRVASEQTTFVAYAGRSLASRIDCYWKVRYWDAEGRASGWSRPGRWSMGLLSDADWYARWIGHSADAATRPLRFPWLRKTFVLKERPQRAAAFVNALGYYELYVNGKKIGDDVLSPAVSDYSKRNLYVTYDIAGHLHAGKNVVALWLGRGWYVRGHPGVVHDGPLVRMQIDGRLRGGAPLAIATDASWKVKESPLAPLGRGTAFGDYGGERYDANLEINGWNAIEFDDSDWSAATLLSPPQVVTAAQMVQPNRITESLKPHSVQETAPGTYLVDMGRNYTGWFELALAPDVPAGQTIRIEYADNLPSGQRFASYNQRDEYITRAGPGQVIRSRFNYHAFRYARIMGLTRPPAATDASGYLIHTAYEPVGDFECSNELLNRIYRTVTWTYRCLTLGGYVVDCPHRERLGYGGDAGTSMETGMFNFDAGGLYNRWTAIWRDSQNPKTGDVPYTAPAYPDQGGGGPMWSGFIITLPWQLYLQYGDIRILQLSYPAMAKFLRFLETKTKSDLLQPYVSYGIKMPQWNFLGDWVTPRRPQSAGGPRDPVAASFINNLYCLYNLQIAAKVAGILGREEDAAQWRQRAGKLQRTLHERFFNADTRSYASGEQPYLAFPLFVNVVPEEHRRAVMQNLENTIRIRNSGQIDAGMHGTYFLLRLLMQEHRNDLIYEMASKQTYPGWGYMLGQDATTIWENWSGGSRIHDTLISIGAWFMEGIAGIRFDEKAPGFRHFFIKPGLVGDLKFARARYKSIRGAIESNWRIDNGSLHLEVAVPAGTTATVWVPSGAPAAVMEGGRPAAGAKHIRYSGNEQGNAVFTLDSGRYAFVSKLGTP